MTTTATSSSRATDRAGFARLAFLLALLIAALALVACGDEQEEPINSTTATSARGGGEAPERADGRGGIELTEIGTFSSPLHVTQPPAGDESLYVVEKGGLIQRVAPDGSASTFLDISDDVSTGSEQGLLSVAFAPDYARSGLLYVDYTNLEGDTRVVEYRAEDDAVDESSARELLAVAQPYPNHNGGLVAFGPDGNLYVGLGDGGSGNDPERVALDLTSPLGKILRVDPAPSGERPYTIPPDNPFARGDEGALPEIYAYGLRNPWRFAFDEASGTLTIGDVGQDAQEEIDVVAIDEAAGADFGWSAFEGTEPLNEDQSAPDAVPPALVATHEDGNCSITGGLVVRDRDLPTLEGRYLYGDLCLGELRSFTPAPGEKATDDVALGPVVEGLASFGEDAEGNVYVASLSGPVYRIDPSG